MGKLKYRIVGEGGKQNVTLYVGSQLYTADSDHLNFEAILEGILANSVDVKLFDVAKDISGRFEKISDRISVRGGTIFLDNDEMDNAITKQILRFLEERNDFMPLVNFMEKIVTNPNDNSREQLYRFLEKHKFTIDPDGDFYAYKSVYKNGDVYTSCHVGAAIVDGVLTDANSRVPQKVGSVVEMARSVVRHDPQMACASGLHAGTWTYARGFSGDTVLLVKINPRDVVSVPTDSNDQKLRTCRYKVVKVVTAEITNALHGVVKAPVVTKPVMQALKPAKLNKVAKKVLSKTRPKINSYPNYTIDGARVCGVKNCNAKHHGCGRCRLHYDRWATIVVPSKSYFTKTLYPY